MKNRKEMLIHKLQGLPEPVLQEVLDSVQFLKVRTAQEHLETALLSESSWQKDWLRPEEDEPWRYL